MRDLYTVLGVAKDADQATIRKAYKKLAREFHPDLNKAPTAADRFKEISAAYEVLEDEERRSLYNEFGEASLKGGFDAERARQWKSMGGGAGGGGFPGGFGGGGVNVDDLFGSLFSGGRRAQAPRAKRGTDIEGTVPIGLMDALKGATNSITVRRPSSCGACQGEGGTGRSACPTCRGTGRMETHQFGGRMAIPCNECDGSGSAFADECATCAGTGRTMQEEILKVKVPVGVKDGQTIRLRGKGGEGERGGPSGDLLLTIEVEAHPFLERDGDDLRMEVPLTLSEAMLGGGVTVPTPLDGEIKVKVPPGVQNGQRMRIKGKGAGEGTSRGDLYLVMRPTPPVTGSPEAQELARALDRFYEGDVREKLRFA